MIRFFFRNAKACISVPKRSNHCIRFTLTDHVCGNLRGVKQPLLFRAVSKFTSTMEHSDPESKLVDPFSVVQNIDSAVQDTSSVANQLQMDGCQIGAPAEQSTPDGGKNKRHRKRKDKSRTEAARGKDSDAPLAHSVSGMEPVSNQIPVKKQDYKYSSKHRSRNFSSVKGDGSAENTPSAQEYNTERQGGKRKGTGNRSLPKANFEPYWTKQKASDALKRGEVIQGSLRINPKKYQQGYISSSDGKRDILVDGIQNRNRALEGDIVLVELLPKEQWKKLSSSSLANESLNEKNVSVAEEVENGSLLDSTENDDLDRSGILNVEGKSEADELSEKVKTVRISNEADASNANSQDDFESSDLFRRTGKVVFIVEKKNPRAASGHLKVFRNNMLGIALLCPTDSRIPRIMIPLSECPEDFKARPQDFENTLFAAHITGWKQTSAFASGKLSKSLGEAGEIEPETAAILFDNNIDFSPFQDAALACLPKDLPWTVPEEEISKRKDLRNSCIFSIDPATARDLDDALSCTRNDDGTFEVGVHIADVSYFVKEGTALDKVAQDRATTVYLVQKAIPMLPGLLCEDLCSLNPGIERLAYSVIWKLNSEGEVLSEWFGRSVIRSCCKLTYDHAQQMIESDTSADLNPEEFPKVDGNHKLEDIYDIVKILHGISVCLRRRRFESGALRLDMPKMSFSLNKETGMPNGLGTYIYKDSNRLIEEFMLLANIAVAHRILKAHPKLAMLRRHQGPDVKALEDAVKLCGQHGITLDASNSQSLHKSLMQLVNSEDPNNEALLKAVILQCTKPMQLAKYFCSGVIDDQGVFRHYALNVPVYTHFTSPIRRYPDIVVHRLLTAALHPDTMTNQSAEGMEEVASHCNAKKLASRKAQELSSELFFTVYVKECGRLNENAVIVGMLDRAIDVMLMRYGLVKRIYCEQLKLKEWKYLKEVAKPGMKYFIHFFVIAYDLKRFVLGNYQW